MANSLTGLAGDIYVAVDMIGREKVGALTSVRINSNGSERVALNGVVRSHFTQQPSASVNVTPSMTIPEGTDQTVDNDTLTISKSKAIQIPWTGEDRKHVDNGAGFTSVYGDQIVQAMRTLTNEMETDLCTTLYKGASRSTGTAGTTPFASNFDIIAESRQILVDNGQEPTFDTSLIVNTLAGTKLRNLAQLQKANEAGGSQLLRQGALLDLQGVFLKESAQIQAHTKGTGTSYLVNLVAGYAVGDTSIELDTGSGTILAGDTLVFAGDTNKYIVKTALAGTTVIINSPGLRETLANNVAVTVGATTTASNILVRQGAAEFVIRPPALPGGRDAADDRMTVVDPHSGLLFEVSTYFGYKKAMFEVAASWGQKAWKSDGIAVVLG